MAADGMGADRFAPLNGATPPGAAPTGGGWAPVLPASLPLPDRIRHPIHGEPTAVWPYRDVGAELLFVVCRFDLKNPDGSPVLGKDGKPKKEVLPYCCGPGGWRWAAPPAPRPLYGLDALAARPGAPVLVVEGEKAADAAARLFPFWVSVRWHGVTEEVI